MQISPDLLVVMVARIAILFGSGGYLFYKWLKATRRYFSDIPFLMGVSFGALAVSKIFDILLYDLFAGVNVGALGALDAQSAWGYARWMFMLVVLSPLLYANLRVWLGDRARLRFAIVCGYAGGFAILILQARSFAELNALTPLILLPAAVLTVVTFFFAYAQRRLPTVHGLLVSLGWLGYIITNSVRPTLMQIGAPPWGLVIVAELLDMAAWGVIFLGFVLRPRYRARAQGLSTVPPMESAIMERSRGHGGEVAASEVPAPHS